MELHEKHREWLHARGLLDTTIEKFSLHTHTDRHGSWLRAPYWEMGKVINHKWRKTMAKDHRMDKDAPLALYNSGALAYAAQQGLPLVITEGEWDTMVLDQCGLTEAVSVPNGAPEQLKPDATPEQRHRWEEARMSPWDAKRYEWVHRHRQDIDRVRSFILATDGDEPGRVLASDLARLLGPERCSFVTYPDGCKDLNEVYLASGQNIDAVIAVIEGAKPYPVAGLYRMEDFPEPPEFQTVSIGVAGLEDLWPVVPGTCSVITGWPGHGKSSLVLVAIANLIKQGIPVALGSFETMVKPVLQRRLRSVIYGCHEASDKAKAIGPADDVINKNLAIICNLHVNEDTELSIETIIENAIVAVLRDGVRLLVLDPWNEIEHKRGRDESETEYVGRAIRLLKRFARDYNCAVWIVAHPRKPASDGQPRKPSLLDLAGSANFANKADYGVIFHRHDLATVQVEATVCKKRMGLPGAMGRKLLAWNELRSGYDLEDFQE